MPQELHAKIDRCGSETHGDARGIRYDNVGYIYTNENMVILG
jgi:hypothetical protein